MTLNNWYLKLVGLLGIATILYWFNWFFNPDVEEELYEKQLELLKEQNKVSKIETDMETEKEKQK